MISSFQIDLLLFCDNDERGDIRWEKGVNV